MPAPRTFTAHVEAADRGGAYVTVPFDVEAAFGSKRPAVRATFDGVPYRGTLVRMGGPDHILLVRKDVRERIGKGPGDAVAAFDALSYTRRKEHVASVEGGKRPETRARRIARAVESVAAR